MGRFDEKVALVTGGSSGIGEAVARAFAAEGAKVAIAARRSKQGQGAASAIRDAGGRAMFVETDVLDAAQIEEAVRQTSRAYGRLDYACNSAGIQGPIGPLHNLTTKQWDDLTGINLKGVWLSLKYEIPLILEQPAGAIVNVASVVGLVGAGGLAAYTAGKFGVVGLTKAAALDYAETGLRINAVCPGSVRTPMYDEVWGDDPAVNERVSGMHPVGRVATPQEIAKAVLWLCSDAASYVTGHSLALDGGISAH